MPSLTNLLKFGICYHRLSLSGGGGGGGGSAKILKWERGSAKLKGNLNKGGSTGAQLILIVYSTAQFAIRLCFFVVSFRFFPLIAFYYN